MKVMISRSGPGAKCRHSSGYGKAESCGCEPACARDGAKRQREGQRLRRCRALQGLQRRHGGDSALSCFEISEL